MLVDIFVFFKDSRNFVALRALPLRMLGTYDWQKSVGPHCSNAVLTGDGGENSVLPWLLKIPDKWNYCHAFERSLLLKLGCH